MLLYAGETLPGSRHDIVMVGGLAKVFPSTADPCTPNEKRVTVVGDAGFRGTEKRLPGIIPVTPHKRNTIHRVPFRGTAGQFRRLFNTAAGLANLAPASDDIVSGAGLYGKLAAK